MRRIADFALLKTWTYARYRFRCVQHHLIVLERVEAARSMSEELVDFDGVRGGAMMDLVRA